MVITMLTNKKIKFFTLGFLFLLILNSCSGITSNKKENNDEFLVQKKSPLLMPPDYNELPIPQSDKNNKDDKSDNSFKNLIEVENKETSVSKGTNKSFEEKILEQIKNN